MFEKEAIEITCPKCGHKSEENVGRLKTDGVIPVPTAVIIVTRVNLRGLSRTLRTASRN
jgi:hypothetical protein